MGHGMDRRMKNFILDITEGPSVKGVCLIVFLAREFFTKSRPVIITDAAEDWPCRQWTIEV